MAQPKTLTEAQVVVLRWVDEGCADGVMEGHFHRISAAALRSRGLVTTSGRGPSWTARITDLGREYLARVDGPDPPVPRKPNQSVADGLIDEVAAAGGVLRVARPRWSYDWDGVDYERRALSAMRKGKLPAGKRLRVITDGDELEIQLVDSPGYTGKRAELVPVVVPEKPGRYHAAARAFRDRTADHRVSRAQLPRAVRIVHAVALEAERRAWTAEYDGALRIAAADRAFSIGLVEKGVHQRGPWLEAVHRARDSRDWPFYRDRERPTGAYDGGATGELELSLGGDWNFSGRQSTWGDRQRWRLETRLPHLFREMEERISEARFEAEDIRIAAQRRAESERRAAEERERRWRVLIDEARGRLVEDHIAKHLRAQASAWREAEELRRYCDAMEAAHGKHPDTAELVAWARRYIARLDPLVEPPSLPEQVDSTPEALQPYLPRGWSAYGPHLTSGAGRSV